jgi:hypothetical protein
MAAICLQTWEEIFIISLQMDQVRGRIKKEEYLEKFFVEFSSIARITTRAPLFSSVGVDKKGEIYFLTYSNLRNASGTIFKLKKRSVTDPQPDNSRPLSPLISSLSPLSGGAIAGIVSGSVLFLVAVVVGLVFMTFYIKRRRNSMQYAFELRESKIQNKGEIDFSKVETKT